MFEKYYSELLGYFSKILYDRDRAQDVVQEAYLKVAALGVKAECIEEPRAFLYKTAHNIVIDEWRKNKNNAKEIIEEANIEACPSEEPLEQVMSNDRMSILQNTIDSLPDRCREAFVLHKFEGYSHREVAEMMGISVNAVEKHIIKALVACKQAVWSISNE
ncbi:MAG: RNA polymerase sigma factor [Campylobacterales bacterium]